MLTNCPELPFPISTSQFSSSLQMSLPQEHRLCPETMFDLYITNNYTNAYLKRSKVGIYLWNEYMKKMNEQKHASLISVEYNLKFMQ